MSHGWFRIGVVAAGRGFVNLLVTLIHKLFFGIAVRGYGSLLVVVLFFSGLLLISNGIHGEYIARIFEEVKGRPLYVLGVTFGFDQPAETTEAPGAEPANRRDASCRSHRSRRRCRAADPSRFCAGTHATKRCTGEACGIPRKRRTLPRMRGIILTLLLISGCALDVETDSVRTSAVRSAATYYVSASSGNDANDGLTQATAWKTLNRVNTNSGGFIGGDQILLKAGDTWDTTTACGGVCQLFPKGSTTAAPYIKIDMYGSGAKPKIVGGGAGEWCSGQSYAEVQGAVYLQDQSGWEIRDLDVSNMGGTQPPDGQGYTPPDSHCQVVGIKARNTGGQGQTTTHIVIANNSVHDVTGLLTGWHGSNTGIAVTADIKCIGTSCTSTPTWSDVTIDNNTVAAVDRVGIFVGPNWSDYTCNPPYCTNYWYGQIDTQPWSSTHWLDGIAITNNKVDSVGGDGILAYVSKNVTISGNTVSNSGTKIGWDFSTCTSSAALAFNGTEYINCNAVGIWTGWTNTATVQLNEVYSYGWPACASGCQAQADGEAFDADMGSTSVTFQYNYSHSNYGGSYQIDYDDTDNLTFRYNVIANDGVGNGYADQRALFRLQLLTGGKTPPDPTGANPPDINNNLIYLGPSQPNTQIISEGGLKSGYGAAAWVYNNIFYALAPDFYPTAFVSNVQFSNDLFSESTGTNRPDETNSNGVIVPDPLLANPTAFGNGFGGAVGFKLAPGSPAITYPGANSGYLGPRDFWGNTIAAYPAAPNRGPYDAAGVTLTKNLLWRGAVTAVSGTGCNSGTEPSNIISTSSAYESVSWQRANMVDGQEYSANNSSGYSSQLGQLCADKYSQHHEWVSICMPAAHSFSKVVLYPRNDSGEVGEAFPIDFHIDTWQGSGGLAHWVTWASQTNVPKPTGPVTVTSAAVASNCIRIVGTNLRTLGSSGYLMEFAEAEAYP